MTPTAWNPWRSLRERADTALAWQELGGLEGLVEVRLRGATVVLDPRLSRRDRRAVLAHELVHLDRRVLPTGTPRAVVDREEFQVRNETARRLVPPALLEQFVARRLADDSLDGVTALSVADEFDVPPGVAQLALERLLLRWAAC